MLDRVCSGDYLLDMTDETTIAISDGDVALGFCPIPDERGLYKARLYKGDDLQTITGGYFTERTLLSQAFAIIHGDAREVLPISRRQIQ